MVFAELVGPLTLAALVVLCVTVLVVVGVYHRGVTVKVGGVTASVEQLAEATREVATKVERVDHAVNQRGPDEQTVSQDIRSMRDTLAGVDERQVRIEETQARQVAEQTMHGEQLRAVRANTREALDIAKEAARIAAALAADVAEKG